MSRKQMKRVAIGCMAGLAAALSFATANASEQTYRGAFGLRGVHVFGNLVLDFGRGEERIGIFSSRLTDCSTDQYFCAASRSFSIVVPRKCERPRVGTEWSLGEVHSRVFGTVPAPEGHLTVPDRLIYLIGDEHRPHVLYGYSPETGITWVFDDPTGTVDFVDLAKSERMFDYYAVARGGGRGREYFNPLLTFDPIAPCYG